MEPTPELVDSIHREKIERSKKLTIQRRIEIGADLSDLGREMMREAIRRDFPDASNDEISLEFRRRVQLSRKLDNLPFPDPRNH
jgi:Rv0078B-related antitoxin